MHRNPKPCHASKVRLIRERSQLAQLLQTEETVVWVGKRDILEDRRADVEPITANAMSSSTPALSVAMSKRDDHTHAHTSPGEHYT